MKQRLLIVGAGMATAFLLQELERHSQDLDITVIGDEEDVCYNRVLLSNVLAGESPEQDLQMLPPGSAARFIIGTRAVSIDTRSREVSVDRGDSFPYDQLILATGSSVARPPIDCEDIAGVMVFRSLADTRQLRSRSGRGRRAIVVGGGLLGLEAAHGLNALGYRTTVLHRNRVIMNRQLDAEGGRQLQRDLERRGIHFHLGASLQEIRAEDDKVCGLLLDDGALLPCDLLLFASGIAPNAGLARNCGIAADRGILVDEFMRTSAPGVFALGECSQFGGHCFGLVAPVRDQAAVLARELCGQQGDGFRVEDYPTQLKISGIDIYRAGELDDEAEQLVLRDEASGLYRRLVLRNNRLVGAVLVGDKRGGTWYARLISERKAITALRAGLIYGKDVAEAIQAHAA